MLSSSCSISEGAALRHFIFVTGPYGKIDIYAHNLADAKDSFFQKGYVNSDIEEIR